MPHCYSVIHTNRVKLERDAASHADFLLYDRTELLKMNVAGYQVDVRITDTDKWFFEICVGQNGTGRPQQTSVRCTCEATLHGVATARRTMDGGLSVRG